MSARRKLAFLAVLVFALLLGLGCSAGQFRARSVAPTPTFTKTLRPTFTPTPPATPTFTPVPPTPTFTPVPPTPTPTPIPPTPTPAAPQVATVNVAKANVRTGPGTVYPRIGQVTAGTQLQIKARNQAGDWIKVCCVNGKEGWIARRLLAIQGDALAINVTTEIPPTPTPRPRPPTPTPTPPQPTPTPAPAWKYKYVEGSMQAAPNCGSVYFEIKVVDQGGNPINGVVVEINWFNNWLYMSTGISTTGFWEPPGTVKFTPLSPEMYHTAVPFRIRLVKEGVWNFRSELMHSPGPGTEDLSDTVVINFEDCNKAGQFTNITFKKVR